MDDSRHQQQVVASSLQFPCPWVRLRPLSARVTVLTLGSIWRSDSLLQLPCSYLLPKTWSVNILIAKGGPGLCLHQCCSFPGLLYTQTTCQPLLLSLPSPATSSAAASSLSHSKVGKANHSWEVFIWTYTATPGSSTRKWWAACLCGQRGLWQGCMYQSW
jgi:hypothetical protein